MKETELLSGGSIITSGTLLEVLLPVSRRVVPPRSLPESNSSAKAIYRASYEKKSDTRKKCGVNRNTLRCALYWFAVNPSNRLFNEGLLLLFHRVVEKYAY